MNKVDDLIKSILELRREVRIELFTKAAKLDHNLAKLVEESLTGIKHADVRKLYRVENEEIKALWSLYVELCDQLLSLINMKRS